MPIPCYCNFHDVLQPFTLCLQVPLFALSTTHCSRIFPESLEAFASSYLQIWNFFPRISRARLVANSAARQPYRDIQEEAGVKRKRRYKTWSTECQKKKKLKLKTNTEKKGCEYGLTRLRKSPGIGSEQISDFRMRCQNLLASCGVRLVCLWPEEVCSHQTLLLLLLQVNWLLLNRRRCNSNSRQHFRSFGWKKTSIPSTPHLSAKEKEKKRKKRK